MPKKLYLHIGIPKTGTSYIQSVLNANSTEENLTVHYPVDKYKKFNFIPTAGNGIEFCRAILDSKSEEAEQLLLSYFSNSETVLLSSEVFSIVDNIGILNINKIAVKNNITIIVIAMVRDLYGYFWSGYSQTIKRGKETRSFIDNARERPLCLDRIYEYAKIGELKIFHYNSMNNILEPFIALGLLKSTKQKGLKAVNIALSNRQMSLVKIANLFLPVKYTSIISDLISSRNKPIVPPHNEEVNRFLVASYTDIVNKFNQDFNLNLKVGYYQGRNLQ